MDDKKILLRPEIESINQDNLSSDFEVFQNRILRPIIKLQHELLISFFQNYTSTRKVNLNEISKEKFSLFVNSSVRKDSSCKNQLIGIITGLFTTKEFENYTQISSEVNKRIIQIIEKRLVDSYEELKRK